MASAGAHLAALLRIDAKPSAVNMQLRPVLYLTRTSVEVGLERAVLLRHVKRTVVERHERNFRSPYRAGFESACHRDDDFAFLIAPGIDRTNTT
ncbi:MAG: hypothetical protein ACXWCS_28520 [Burkholderiales bacterium]